MRGIGRAPATVARVWSAPGGTEFLIVTRTRDARTEREPGTFAPVTLLTTGGRLAGRSIGPAHDIVRIDLRAIATERDLERGGTWALRYLVGAEGRRTRGHDCVEDRHGYRYRVPTGARYATFERAPLRDGGKVDIFDLHGLRSLVLRERGEWAAEFAATVRRAERDARALSRASAIARERAAVYTAPAGYAVVDTSPQRVEVGGRRYALGTYVTIDRVERVTGTVRTRPRDGSPATTVAAHRWIALAYAVRVARAERAWRAKARASERARATRRLADWWRDATRTAAEVLQVWEANGWEAPTVAECDAAIRAGAFTEADRATLRIGWKRVDSDGISPGMHDRRGDVTGTFEPGRIARAHDYRPAGGVECGPGLHTCPTIRRANGYHTYGDHVARVVLDARTSSTRVDLDKARSPLVYTVSLTPAADVPGARVR